MKKGLYLASILAGTALVGFSEMASALSIKPQTNQPILWPEGTIQYYVDVPTPWFSLVFRRISSPEAEAQMREAVAQGIAEWNAVGAENNRFKFVLVNKEDIDPSQAHLVINLRGYNKTSECGAGVDEIGYPGAGDRTILSLPEGCPGAIVHELGHVLGFVHEHMRKDANLVLNKCNHIKAGETSCNNIYTNGWAGQIAPVTLTYLTDDYDPFSVMHYDLQNNLKEELVGEEYYDPETGVTYYYTTIDFTRDLSKTNNVFDLADRLNMTIPELYDNMIANRDYGAKLSEQDKAAAKAFYERDLVDTHATLVKTCYTRNAGGTDCTAAGQFKVVMTATNFGAWAANNVKLNLPLPNVDQSTLSWSAPSDVECQINGTNLECDMPTLPGQAERAINVTAQLANPDSKVSLEATVSTSSAQHPSTLTSTQFTSAKVSVGGP